MGTSDISRMAEARVVKFCVHVYIGYVKSQHKDDKSLLKEALSGHVTHFKFCCPGEAQIVKFCVQVDYVKIKS